MVSEAVHKAMVGNKGRDTKPELLVRQALRAAGLTGYRLQWKKAPGRPDIAFVGAKVAIYVDGCFWHRCPHCNLALPKSNVEYWQEKFERNVARDERNHTLAREQGWTVIRIWECELKKAKREETLSQLIARVREARGETVTYALVEVSDGGDHAAD